MAEKSISFRRVLPASLPTKKKARPEGHADFHASEIKLLCRPPTLRRIPCPAALRQTACPQRGDKERRRRSGGSSTESQSPSQTLSSVARCNLAPAVVTSPAA